MLSLRLNQVVYEWDGHMGDLKIKSRILQCNTQVNKCKKKMVFLFFITLSIF